MPLLQMTRAGESCLYINKLTDVDIKVFETIMRTAHKYKQQSQRGKD